MSRASTWGNEFIKIDALSSNDYGLHLGDAELFFGVADKRLYISSTQGLPTEGNTYLRDQHVDIDDCRFYATFFAPALFSALLSQAADNGLAIPLPPALQQIQRLNITMEEAGDFHLSLIAPEGVNIAKELINNKL